MSALNMSLPNSPDTREGWLRVCTDALRPMFSAAGLTIPAKIRFAVAFPSAGAKGKAIGECWQAMASADAHYEIIIRADQSKPVDVLAILVHELIHASLPAGAGHGKTFRKAAIALGLTGKMTATLPDMALVAKLETIAEGVGQFPHSNLDFQGEAMDKPKKQGTRMLKAQCQHPECGYMVRLTKKWADLGLPECPLDAEHGKLVCEVPAEEGEEGEGE